MIGPVLALGGAFGLELAGVWQLVRAFTDGATPLPFIPLHVAGSALAAGVLCRLMPGRYQDDSHGNFLFLFLGGLAIPLLGVVGLSTGLLPALWRQRPPAAERDFIRCSVARPLAGHCARQDAQEAPADGALMGSLLCAPAREHRLRALIATLSLDVRQALPLLRIGLRDTDDDVRLLSYALLSRKEKALETRIASARSRLEHAPESERFALYRSLARDYAELGELAHDASSGLFLREQAEAHALAAARIRPGEADIHFLLGRMLLKKNDLEGARAAFLRAAAAGVAHDKVAIYLAEIAFHRQQLSQVGQLIRVEKRAVSVMLAVRLGAYWGPHHGR